METMSLLVLLLVKGLEQHPQGHSHEVDEAQLYDPNLPTCLDIARHILKWMKLNCMIPTSTLAWI